MAKAKDYEMLYKLRDELNAILGDSDTEDAADAATTEGDYDSMSFSELKKACKAAGLPTSGTRDELIARLVGDTDSDEEEEEVPEEKPAKKTRGRSKKEPEPEPEPEEEEEEEGDDIQSQVEAATADMSLEELADFCEENGLSPKGKRQALISRIVKAVEAGDIELGDDEDEGDEEEEEPEPPKKSKSGKAKKEPEPEEEEEGEETPEHAAAVKKHAKETRAQFKNGELERNDLVEFLCDFYDKKSTAYKKSSDADILDMYIEATSKLIDDEGELIEEGAYTVNGVPFCCGRPLDYDEDNGQYVCSHCGESYDAEDE